MAFMAACCWSCSACLLRQQQQMRAMTMMAPMMAPATAPLMVPTLAPLLQQYQQVLQQQEEQQEQFSGQYPQQLQQLQSQQQLQQTMCGVKNNYKKCWIQSVLLCPLNKINHILLPHPSDWPLLLLPANLLLEAQLPNYLPVFASLPCVLVKSKAQYSTNSLVQIKGYFHQHMGNCCYADDNVDYGMLVPQPPRETIEYRREAHPDSYLNPKQTSNLPPQPPSRLSGAPGDSERQSYFRKTSSISQNAPHLRQYHHVHIVKPPSYLQSSGQMALFQDDKNLGRLMNPNLAIRTSNPPYKPSLEGIREQQMTYI